jgi:hypothetical protein
VLLEVDTNRVDAVRRIFSATLPDATASTQVDLTGRARILELRRPPA